METRAHQINTGTTRLTLLGLPVDRVTMRQAVEWLAASIEAVRTSTTDGGPPPVFPATVEAQHAVASLGTKGEASTRQVVTLNPEIAMTAQRDAKLRAAILQADLVVPDGMGIIWGARLKGMRLPERVTGVDLIERFAALAAQRGYRIFLLGAAPGVAERVQRQLEQRLPGVCICGTDSGSPAPEAAAAICARIRAARPDVLFVAFGAPAQESWIAHHHAQLGAAVAIGVGGAFDFIAGVVPRAPEHLRRLGFEWAYRLWREPWRWRRMLALPRFALAIIIESIDQRRSWKIGVDAGRGRH